VNRVFQKTAETFIPGSMTMPQKFYTSPEVFDRETERIFRRYWFCVGHSSRIPSPGEFFVQEILGESLIFVRDRNGEIRAFYNVCRHRGARICEESSGRFGNSIQCIYHAWTYGLDGKLIGAPFMKEAPGFNFDDYPLRSAPVGIWEGFIFVNMSLDGEGLPFDELFAPLQGLISQWNVSKLKMHHREPYEIASNWKYVFQNFNECYHCPTIHPALSKLTTYTSAANDLTEGPFLGGAMDLTEESMTVTGRVCAMPLGEFAEGDEKRAYYYSLLPNLLLNIHPDYVMYHMIFPRSPGKSLIVSEWLFHPEAETKPNFNPQGAIDFWHETNLQDWHVCELSQRGVQSAAYTPGWYTPRESLLAAFDRDYLKTMDMG
jgi:glycine betaine catabolism A